jgi:hypothetical protein
MLTRCLYICNNLSQLKIVSKDGRILSRVKLKRLSNRSKRFKKKSVRPSLLSKRN